MINYTGRKYKKPFPYTVIDDFIPAELVAQINAEWPVDTWEKEDGAFNLKWNTQVLPPAARSVVDEIELKEIEAITGIDNLIADPGLGGAGLHCHPRGGFLNMHCDYNVHPQLGWHRRVNVLVYLNEAWRPEWGGAIRLGLGAQQKQVQPVAGRAVVFETTGETWHGHPEPLQCPADRQRRSLAMYYYTEEPPPEGEQHSTLYIKSKRKRRK